MWGWIHTCARFTGTFSFVDTLFGACTPGSVAILGTGFYTLEAGFSFIIGVRVCEEVFEWVPEVLFRQAFPSTLPPTAVPLNATKLIRLAIVAVVLLSLFFAPAVFTFSVVP